jgi:hypothetical protein
MSATTNPFVDDPDKVFQFRLALALGRTVEELHASMSHSEYADWVRFANYEPFGEIREDYRFGNLGAQIATVMAGKKGQTLKIDDFRLQFRHSSNKMRMKQLESNAATLMALFGVGPPDKLKLMKSTEKR